MKDMTRRSAIFSLGMSLWSSTAWAQAAVEVRDLDVETARPPRRRPRPAPQPQRPVQVSLMPVGPSTIAIGQPIRFRMVSLSDGFGHLYVLSGLARECAGSRRSAAPLPAAGQDRPRIAACWRRENHLRRHARPHRRLHRARHECAIRPTIHARIPARLAAAEAGAPAPRRLGFRRDWHPGSRLNTSDTPATRRTFPGERQ